MADVLDTWRACRGRPNSPGWLALVASPGERMDAVVAVDRPVGDHRVPPAEIGWLDAAARRHSRWLASAGRRRAVATARTAARRD